MFKLILATACVILVIISIVFGITLRRAMQELEREKKYVEIYKKMNDELNQKSDSLKYENELLRNCKGYNCKG